MHCIRCALFKLHVVMFFLKRFTIKNTSFWLEISMIENETVLLSKHFEYTLYIIFENRMRSYLTFHHHSLVTDDYNVRGCLGY